ncbi:ATP-binding protein [Streptomyces sp. NPDC008150]|uniref:ATP-binding protein n=1 Tax=Streptomyces sp. NPDC008150 TaxID=3364816 RepID=UPI0036EBD06A
MTTSQVEPPLDVHEFTHTFPTTRLGASLARLAAVAQLDDWGVPFGSTLSDTVALIVAELAANVVRHGRVPGRNFGLRLRYERATAVARVEVSDTHPLRPDPATVVMADADADGGRGLALVAALADDWGVEDRTGPGKTVWAQTGPADHPEPSEPHPHGLRPARPGTTCGVEEPSSGVPDRKSPAPGVSAAHYD